VLVNITVQWHSLLVIILITVIFITFVLFLEFHQWIILFQVTTLPTPTFLHSLSEHSFVHFNLLAIHSHEGNWQTWWHLQDVNSSIMSGAGSLVIQLMQSPLVPPLSVLPPSMAILRGRNSRLGLKASSPYCRLVLHVCWFKVWRKLIRLNHNFLACQRLKRRSFMSVSGVLDTYNLQVKACSVFRTSELKSSTHNQSDRRHPWTHRSAEWVWGPWFYPCRECTYRVTPGKRMQAQQWLAQVFTEDANNLCNAQKTALIFWWDEHV